MARPSCVRFDLLVVVIVGVALFSSSLAGRRKYRKNPYYLRDHNEKESEDDKTADTGGSQQRLAAAEGDSGAPGQDGTVIYVSCDELRASPTPDPESGSSSSASSSSAPAEGYSWASTWLNGNPDCRPVVQAPPDIPWPVITLSQIDGPEQLEVIVGAQSPSAHAIGGAVPATVLHRAATVLYLPAGTSWRLRIGFGSRDKSHRPVSEEASDRKFQ